MQRGDIAGLVSAQKWIEIGGDINGRGILKSHSVIRLAERIRDDLSIQCKIEAKDIQFSTSQGLTLGQAVGERASITARYFEVPARYLNDGSEAVKLKSLSITVEDHERINICLSFSVSDAAVTLKAGTITLGHTHAPKGLTADASTVTFNGSFSEETAEKLTLRNVKDLSINGNYVALNTYFNHTLNKLTIGSAGRLDVRNFSPTVKLLVISGSLKASDGIQFSGCEHVMLKGSKDKRAHVLAGNSINFFNVQRVELDNVEIISKNQIALGDLNRSIHKLSIGKEVRAITEDKLFIRLKEFDVNEEGGVSARQGNVFQGKTVVLETQDGDIHYRLLRMGIRTIEGGKLTIVTNGELSLQAFEEGGFSFHHGHFKATKVNLARVNEITIWSGDMTIEFQPNATKTASADPNDSSSIMFEIDHHTVILGKLTVLTPESRVVVDPGAKLDVRGGMRVNSLRNRGILISTGGDNYITQKFLNHGKATLSNLDVWNFESSQREWGRPNFTVNSDLKIQRYFAMYGSNGRVQGSIIFHQGDSTNDWSGYAGYFRLCPVNLGAGNSWVTTREEVSPVNSTKMNTFQILRGDGCGSKLVVYGHIHSPEGKKLNSFDIIASDLIVQSGVVELDVNTADEIKNLTGYNKIYGRQTVGVGAFVAVPVIGWIAGAAAGVNDTYGYTNYTNNSQNFRTRIRAIDFRLRVNDLKFELKEKKPEVLGNPEEVDALVLTGAEASGFKVDVVKGNTLAQVTPLRIDASIIYSQDGVQWIEVHGIELSQGLVDSFGRMGYSAQNVAATYIGVPRNVVTLVSANAPQGALGAQGLSAAAMLHTYSEMTNAAGMPYLNQNARSIGEDFALVNQDSVYAGAHAARVRLGEKRFSLEIKDIEFAQQALRAFMSLVEHSQSRPALTANSDPIDLAKLEQMLDDSELMCEFKSDVKEITGLHHELISVPDAQKIIKARQPVVNRLARDGFESLELRSSEMSQFLEGGDRFYTERVLIDGRWVDLARISVSDATRRYWGSDFKGLKVGNNLHMTCQNGAVLFGLIEAQNDLIITVHSGTLELGPQDANTISVIGGRRRTILHVKDGQLLLHPGVKLLGQQVILMADNGISLSPLVVETWRSKTERSGLLWLGSTRTTTKDISYKERFTLDDGSKGIIIYSKDGDVNVSGAHIGNQDSPVVLLAGKNVLMEPLLTDTYHQVDDKGVFSHSTTTARGQAVKSTKISNIPNAVTLEKVLTRPDILEAILADMLGVSTERHRRLLLTDKDAKAIRQGTVLIRAMGNVTGKAINLATAFAEISAGGKIQLSAVDTTEETHSEGWSINFFGGLGQAICNLFDSGSKEVVASVAQVAEADRNKAIAQRMGALTAVFSAIFEHLLQEQIRKAIGDTPLREMQLWATAIQEGRPTELPRKIWEVVCPFAGVVTANFSGIGESIVNLARLGDQRHSLAGVGAVMTITQGVIEGFKMYEALSVIAKPKVGFSGFLEKGFAGIIEDAASIGFSFYESYTKKKIQVPGEIKALFSLKLQAGSLLNISGTAMQSFLGDWRARQIHVGCVKEGTQSRHESGGFSVNPVKLTASVHGEWGKEQSVINRPVYYCFNFLNIGEVDELHMYGGVIRASFGFGRIRKLVMHHEVDTGQQSGGGFSVTFPISPSAVSTGVLDNIKSLSVSISKGGMVRLSGGKCIFDVPGIEILNWQEFNIPDRQYDDRTTVTATWNNTTLGDAAPTGTTAVGSIGMQVGDVHVHTDITSGMIPGRAGRELSWHKRTFQELKAIASQRELDEEELKQLLHSKGELEKAAERRKAELLEKRKARTLTREEAEELQPILDREAAEREAREFKDPTDITDYSAPYEDMDQPEPAAADEKAAASGGGEEGHPHTDPADGGEYSETPDSIKESPIWQLYDEEGKEAANDYYRLQKEEERLDKGGVPSDAPERVALREDMRNIVDYMKQSGYLGQNEEGYKNMALPGEKDYYLPEEGLDHFMPEFWFGGGRAVQRTFIAGRWIYQRLTTSKAEASPSGSSLDSIKGELQEYLGADYRTITNKSGDKVFLSRDGNRCVRFDVKNPHGDKPHIHIQYFNGKKWLDATNKHRIQFKD